MARSFSSGDEFSRMISDWADGEERVLKLVAKRVAFGLFEKIVKRTPVDTGRARASWNIVAGESEDLTVAPEDFRGGAGAGNAAALGRLTRLQNANSYVISNNLPYIVRLEEGHSGQAPVGMAVISLAEMEAELEREFR